MPPSPYEARLLWLLQISRTMLATREVHSLLTLITDAFVELVGADRGFYLGQEPEGTRWVPHRARSADGMDLPDNTDLSPVIEQVAASREPRFANEVPLDPTWGVNISGHIPAFEMVACVPLCSDNGVVGVLYADTKSRRSEVAVEMIQRAALLLAEHGAAAIENARLFERASNDLLTGLPNSNHFLYHLAKTMREASPQSQAGVLLLDLDAFKRINDVAGAGAGDKVLVDIANSLQDVLRADGLVARYGSDKFALLLPPDPTTRARLRLRDAAERARACVATKVYYGVSMTASIGGLAFPGPDAESAPDLIAATDDILARARARGPGNIEIG